MKNRYQVLKQMRLYYRYSIPELSKALQLSEEYIEKLESGNIQNVEYLYERYGKFFRMKSSRIKRIITEAEKGNYDVETIIKEISKTSKDRR